MEESSSGTKRRLRGARDYEGEERCAAAATTGKEGPEVTLIRLGYPISEL